MLVYGYPQNALSFAKSWSTYLLYCNVTDAGNSLFNPPATSQASKGSLNLSTTFSLRHGSWSRGIVLVWYLDWWRLFGILKFEVFGDVQFIVNICFPWTMDYYIYLQCYYQLYHQAFHVVYCLSNLPPQHHYHLGTILLHLIKNWLERTVIIWRYERHLVKRWQWLVRFFAPDVHDCAMSAVWWSYLTFFWVLSAS